MRLVTWNCNGALRNKTHSIDALNADILIIQECECPDASTETFKGWAGKHLWVGKSKNKGLGVFSRTNIALELCDWNGSFQIDGLKTNHPALQWHTSDLELFLPSKLGHDITMLSVWTKQAKSPTFGHIGQFWKYLQINRSELARNKTIIIGDFNSNSIWDKPDRWWNHTDVVNELREIRIESLYHYQYKETHGRESKPTFYMYRNTK